MNLPLVLTHPLPAQLYSLGFYKFKMSNATDMNILIEKVAARLEAQTQVYQLQQQVADLEIENLTLKSKNKALEQQVTFFETKKEHSDGKRGSPIAGLPSSSETILRAENAKLQAEKTALQKTVISYRSHITGLSRAANGDFDALPGDVITEIQDMEREHMIEATTKEQESQKEVPR